MVLNFTKMHGIGNDYIYFDAISQNIENPSQLAIKYSDRHFGIGSDGVILICKSDVADAKMRMFNADGSEGNMCGNGIRCVGKYIYDHGIVDKGKRTVTVETKSGIKTLELFVKNDKVDMVKVDMGKADFEPKNIPVIVDTDTAVDVPITVLSKEYKGTCVSMGNPHCVIFVDDTKSLELEKIGPYFEHNAIFPEGVNTEFIKVIDEHTLEMRVWERGSGETFACGTGACASVSAACKKGYCKKGEDITVKLLGGDLVINVTDETVYMTGTATEVFKGEIEI
ncbi:MAG: diaminopimelate epimerase [Oscillospiraceae bacterium]|nr:diaminopimelate epimerase [Candidatus Ruminococcus equi]